MQSHPTTHEASKRRSQRSSDVLQEYLKGLDGEHANLVAQRDYIQVRLDLIERQRANLQEVIQIDEKLAELGLRSPDAPETSPEAVSQESKVATA
jgi:hypothetical protein